MKQIWIVNYYTSPPDYVANPRHLKFANYLMQSGYDVTIFSTSFLRSNNIDFVPKDKKYIKVTYDNYRFVHIKSLHYSGNGIKRMLSIFQFSYRLLFYRKKFNKPDIILHNIHAPFDYLISVCAKKLKANYIVEAWDLWPDSFVRFGLIKPSNPIVKIAYYLEKKLYERADRIIFSLEGGIDYIKEKKWDKEQGGNIELNKIHYINNGVDLDEFKNNKKEYRLKHPELEDNEFFKVVYLGAIRQANNLQKLIDAAVFVQKDPTIKFLIFGRGSERANLEKYCQDRHIKNVIFKDQWVSLNYVPYLLSCSSLNILNYRKNFGKYGISSGKFFLYLASGKPTLSNTKMNYCLINKYNLGIANDIETSQEYADAILKIKNMSPLDYESMCNRTKEVVKQFDYKNLSHKLLKIIENI